MNITVFFCIIGLVFCVSFLLMIYFAEHPIKTKEYKLKEKQWEIEQEKKRQKIVAAEIAAKYGEEKIEDFEYEAAITHYDMAINECPKADYYFKRGFCYYNIEKYDLGILDLTQAISLNTRNIDAYLYRATCYNLTDQENLACLDWNQAEIMGSDEGKEMCDKYCKDFFKKHKRKTNSLPDMGDLPF